MTTERKGKKASESPRDILTRYMTEQQMRKTPERFAILDVVMSMNGHYSADQIIERMPEDFHVSKGTMYSTLTLLIECGLVFSHQMASGATLYEKAHGVSAHNHYICTGCGKIWDLKNDSINKLVMDARTPKFKKLRCSTYIYGVCNVCQAKISRFKKKQEKHEKMHNEDLELTREEARFAKIGEELGKAAKWFK